jgi:hypothetical protein
MESVTIIKPTTAELRERYEDDEISGVGKESRRLQERIRELTELLPKGATISLSRNWEGDVHANIDGDDRFDVLCILDDGRVGYGGINLPEFFPTVADYLEAGHGF